MLFRSFIDGLNQGGGLARTGRAVHHHHVLGPEHLVDGVLLGGVEPGQLDVVEGEARRSGMAVEEVAQIGQTVAAGMDDAVQGIGHKPVAGLVEVTVLSRLQRESANIDMILNTFDGLYDTIEQISENKIVLTDRFGEKIYANLESHVSNVIMDYCSRY